MLVLLAACASSTTDRQSYDKYLAGWIGDKEENLVVAFGIPNETHVMANGGRVLEYARGEDGGVVCRTRFTVDGNGRIERWWYKGTACHSPGAG